MTRRRILQAGALAPFVKLAFSQDSINGRKGAERIAVGVFDHHPADYAILGGCWGMEEGGSVHHNAIIAGPNAVSIDAAGAAVMGFVPAEIPFLKLAAKRGLGVLDVDALWVRGVEIDEARRPFRKPTQ